MQEKLKQGLRAIQGISIPQIPKEVFELDALLRSKFPNTVDVANIIEQNTTLSGETLKLINSPIIKPKEPIKSIRDAVNKVGLVNIYNLVVASALKNVFSQSTFVKDIIDHSVDVAFCMSQLADMVDSISRDEAYMMGLFHHSGAMLLAKKAEDVYTPIYSNGMTNPATCIAKEDSAFGSNHCIIGVLVSQKWRLPINMINAIYRHHTPDISSIQNYEVRSLVAMLQLANAIVSEISMGAYCGSEVKQYHQAGQKELMISDKQLNEIRQNLMSYSLKT